MDRKKKFSVPKKTIPLLTQIRMWSANSLKLKKINVFVFNNWRQEHGWRRMKFSWQSFKGKETFFSLSIFPDIQFDYGYLNTLCVIKFSFFLCISASFLTLYLNIWKFYDRIWNRFSREHRPGRKFVNRLWRFSKIKVKSFQATKILFQMMRIVKNRGNFFNSGK